MNELNDSVAKGALKGARGNSGVILSQLFRGMCSVFKDKDSIDIKTFAKAMECGTQIAYSAVSKPKEGTILTVARMMSEHAAKITLKHKDLESFLEEVIQKGEEALAQTPELLPVLKKAGVVDAGGMGLLVVYKGFLKSLKGEEIEGEVASQQLATENGFGDNADIINLDLGEIEFAYCTEFFIINLKKITTLADIDKLKEKLMKIGDSVICIGDLEMVKIHVHTNTPGVALGYALDLGELDKIKIENMLEENRALKAKRDAEKKELGMLAICTGEGIADIFKDLLVDRVIEGGQTMNPSASDIANAASRVNAKHVFIFPNNKNIILAAEQAQGLVSNRKLHVIPTKNIPQGFAAALAFNPDASAEENKAEMIHSLDNIKAGSLTYAVRSTDFGNIKVEKGDIIGLDDKKILAKGNNIDDTLIELITLMREESHEIITLYFGQDVTEEQAAALDKKIAEKFPDCDVDYHYGGQPIYYYLVSLE
jgi:DAK2 domain fusion protein YloV